MPTVHDIEEALYEWAPKDLAASWDNVGHLVGDPARPVARILVALDITPDVVDEAAQWDAQLIVSHHPVMNIHWHERELNTLRQDTRLGKLLTTMVRKDVAAICMHTNLDAARDGVNDILAHRLGLTHLEPLDIHTGIGRVGLLPESMELMNFLALVRKRLAPNGIRFVDARHPIRKVAVGGGSCGDLAQLAIDKGCDAFVTADVKYDQFLDAAARGLHLLDAGHFPTEDVVCSAVVQRLEERFPGVTVRRSICHREIIQYYV